ncbi:MAG TPA: hypothetical protein DCL61_14610 [Cyanobacteria bacterium UBA12227]|nr:hypothetical protein [Cyanobacteria bacterium UBA12227]HAX85268.1 hypothetical protein [Cyanobacteria bacterium UBA11370]HBY77823.1 hypothetical protein [Cyanobacteria bacterium UBA11148]
MLPNHFVYLAIEPVTTTITLVAIGKALGLFGAAATGATLGNAASQKAKGKETVNWGEAASRGTGTALDSFSVTQQISDIASSTDSSDQKKSA